MGRRKPRGSDGSNSCNLPCRIDMSRLGDHVDAVWLDLQIVFHQENLHVSGALKELA